MRIWLFGSALAAVLFVGAQAQAQEYIPQYWTPGYSPNYYPSTSYGYGGGPVYGGPNFTFNRGGYFSPALQPNGSQSYQSFYGYPAYGYTPQGFAPQFLYPQTSWYGGYRGSTSRYWNR